MKFAVHANRDGQNHLNYNRLLYGTCPEQAAEDAAHKRHVTSHRVIGPDEYLHNDSLTCLQRHQDCDFARMEKSPRIYRGTRRRGDGSIIGRVTHSRAIFTTPWCIPQGAEHKKSRLSLSILGTCRQLYEEGSHLLWSTNTFSFSDSLTFYKFIARLNAMQRRKLNNIHIGIDWEDATLDWASVLNDPGLLGPLRGLRFIQICLDQSSSSVIEESLVLGDRDPEFEEHWLKMGCTFTEDYPAIKALHPLQMLPLEHVGVTITDEVGSTNSSAFPRSPLTRWTVEKKRSVAERVRCRLLNSEGNNIFETEWQDQQAAKKIRRQAEQQERKQLEDEARIHDAKVREERDKKWKATRGNRKSARLA